jgi:D-glycero-D-manno-heptose 1,7-bisphosphate phosphatase
VNSSRNKAAFLDRDGVINDKPPEGEYITSYHDIRFIPGALDAAAKLKRAGYQLFIITNQRGVATRKLTIDDLTAIHAHIAKAFERTRARISHIYYCPHDISEMCSCRKPHPGMLERAAQEYCVDLQASWMIGDSAIDVQAGQSAGCRTVLIGNQAEFGAVLTPPTLVAENLASAADQIVNLDAAQSVPSSSRHTATSQC